MKTMPGTGARRIWVALAATLGCTSAAAQEGYPLDGTWRGMIGEPASKQVVVVMKWDGETINGTINPGPSSRPFESASLDAETWTVRIEADSTDGVPVTIQGRLEDIGSYNRTITGTWTEGDTEYAFRMTRQ